MADRPRPSFGIKTVPMHTTYDDVLRVWQEADEIPEIEHAWLWDHMLPLFGAADGTIHEGWTMLAALVARTERLGAGLMVTSNATRPPAVLAKMAATADVISRGRLVLGIGVGATRQPAEVDNPGVREYAAYGLPLAPPGEGIARLAEACTIIKRLWTEQQFDFHGRYYHLTGAVCEPKPVQRPRPPIMIGGWGDRTLRVVAEHADIWNAPGPPFNSVDYLAERGRVLDAHCADIGRDPQEIVRSTQIHVSDEHPAETRAAISELLDAGVTHIVLNLARRPFPDGVARWAADEIITPVREGAPTG